MAMRVLLVGDYPPPHGGVAVHVQQLHQYLRSRGVEAKVLDIGKGGRPAPDVLPVRSAADFGLRLAGFLRDGWTVHVHTSGNNPKAWVLAGAAGVPGPRAPRFITLHSGLLPDFLAASPARRALARAALAGYTRIVAVSDAVQDALLASGVPRERVVVYPAFCASQVKPGPVSPRVAQARQRRSVLLAYAHHPSPVYGRLTAFRALRRLAEAVPGVGLAVFGPGTRSDAFVRDARELGVAGHLEDLGELGHAEALALLQVSDAFLRPTTHDGDSISVREALALSTPCVASDVCARPEGTLTFRAGDADDLARRVREALRRNAPRTQSPDAGPVVLGLYRDALRVGLEPRAAVPAP